MNKKVIIKILIISMLIMAFCITVYCAEGTVKMKIDNSTAWTNITVSESYKKCEELNSTTSTLGTSALKAHLTTDYDWSAMAIFSVSQYGGATSNSPSSTNNNKSGIYDMGSRVQTTTLLNTSTSTSNSYVSGLYDESGNPKKYVNKINPTTGEDQNGRVSISYLSSGGTWAWFGASSGRGTQTAYPVSMRNGLFGVIFGIVNNYVSSGGRTGATFRPVIWN